MSGYVVMGIAVNDERQKQLITNVVRVAAVMTAWAIITQIGLAIAGSNYSAGSVWLTAFINILIALLIPACGYFGAKNRNQCLVGCFCGWSACCGACGICGIVSMFALIGGANAANEFAASNYYYYFTDGEKAIFTIMLIIGTALDCAGFFFGNKLYSENTLYVVTAAPAAGVPMATVGTPAQPYPQGQYPQAQPAAGYPQGQYPQAQPAAGYPQAQPAAGYPQAQYPQAQPAAGYPQAQPAAGYPQAQPAAGYAQNAKPQPQYPQAGATL